MNRNSWSEPAKGSPGWWLRRRRTKLGLTQRQMAERCRVTQPTIAEWEANQSYPSTALLRRVAEQYEVDIRRIVPASKDRA